MGKDFEISDKIKNYIENLSKELHPVQKEIISYNETLGEIKKMQIAVSQCYFLELIRPCLGEILPTNLEDYSLVVVLGGPISVNDDDSYIKDEIN